MVRSTEMSVELSSWGNLRRSGCCGRGAGRGFLSADLARLGFDWYGCSGCSSLGTGRGFRSADPARLGLGR